jgi:hypothetical protein
MAPGLVPGERAITNGHQAVEVGKFFEGNKIWRFYETGWSAVNLGSLRTCTGNAHAYVQGYTQILDHCARACG